jgi:hypothetical protein
VIDARKCGSIDICMCTHTHTPMHVHIHGIFLLCVCMYIYIYIHTHTHTHTHTNTGCFIGRKFFMFSYINITNFLRQKLNVYGDNGEISYKE